MLSSIWLNRRKRQRRFRRTEVLEQRVLLTAPQFTEVTGAGNPYGAIDLHTQNAAPALIDIDDDGDLDAVVGSNNGRFRLLENTGTSAAPDFRERVLDRNPLSGVQVDGHSIPILGDFDDDGDLDLVSPSTDRFVFLENTGTASSAAFTARSGSENPLNGIVPGSSHLTAVGDVDGDGDLDMISGGETRGTLVFIENTGTTASPSFVLRTGADNPVNDIVRVFAPSMMLGDLDGDGDADLVVGNFNQTLGSHLTFYRNDGGDFVAETHAVQSVETRSSHLVPADLDGDGDLDLIVGHSVDPPSIEEATVRFIENTGTVTDASFAERIEGNNPFYNKLTGGRSTPALVDLDADGDLDLVVGDVNGQFRFFENTGTADAPVMSPPSGGDPFDGIRWQYNTVPVFGDLDNDGDLDMLIGRRSGVGWLENIGTAQDPEFVPLSDTLSPLDGFSLGVNTAPALADIDNDGDLDLLVGGSDFDYLENTGTPESPEFTRRNGSENPFDAVSTSRSGIVPVFVDIDGDGDVDLILSRYRYGGHLQWLHLIENTGTASSPEFTPRLGDESVFPASAVSEVYHTSFGDVDADGDLDFVARGDSRETQIRFFEASPPDVRLVLPAGGQPLTVFLAGNTVEVRDGATVLNTVDAGSENQTLRIVAAGPAIVILDSSLDGYSGRLIYQGGTRADSVDARALTRGIEFHGGFGADRFIGGSGRDTVFGGRGRDRLNGGDGRDILDGGPGNDRLFGKNGRDTLLGGNGHDRLIGGPQRDWLDGGSGNDLLEGRRHPDTLTGGFGDDTLDGGPRFDWIVETTGRDGNYRLTDTELISGSDRDEVRGIEAASLTGDSGNNTLDTRGFSGRVQLTGGAGNDVLLSGPRNDVLDGGTGHDTLRGGSGPDSLSGGDGNDVLEGENGLDDLAGGTGNDVLNGGAHADRLLGGPGNDTLRGGRAADVLLGESGDDDIDGESGTDQAAGGGNGTVTSPGDVLAGVEETIDLLMRNFRWLDD